MTAGRRPIPSYLKEVTGTTRKARVNTAEPKMPVARPRLPEHLTSYARLAWMTYAPLLEKMGVLTRPDALALERLCECYGEIRTYAAVLAKEGLSYRPVLTDSKGVPMMDGNDMAVLGPVKMRPEVAAMANADVRMKNWLSEFGLTPSARTKVKGVPQDAKPAPGSDLLD